MEPRRLGIPEEELSAFCKEHHIRQLALLGSVLTGNQAPDSDIDVLVEFEAGHVPGLLRLARMERELSVFLGGRKVDMRTPQGLSRYFRDEVAASAEVQYAAK